MIKVDFRNAFNSICRDMMLKAVENYIPDLLPFVHSAYSSPSILLWGDSHVPSAEGIQQGDPVGPMLFCLTIHELVCNLLSKLKVFFLDDCTIGGNLEDLQTDLQRIEDQGQVLGLELNVDKSELISHDRSAVGSSLSIFPGLHFVDTQQAMLLYRLPLWACCYGCVSGCPTEPT